ncbi:MAG: type II toxin-antitoxin system HipA family toxin [Pseudomonadota bacterium]
MRIEPVWAWLTGAETPTQVGVLTRVEETGAGSFLYDASYLKAGGHALDPGQLRHRDARRPIPIRAADREGIPGIIADAGPDAWGRRVLAQDLGYEPDALDALTHSADDGAGHLTVGDLTVKPAIELLDLVELADAIERRQAGIPAKAHRLVDQVLSPDTALGGAKPKASTQVAGFPWIAKFTERGDPIHLPFYEAAAMRMAARIGLNCAEVKVEPLPQGRSALLVKRFDRLPGGTRIPMASGLTVLGPAAQGLGPARSYLKLGQALKKWAREADSAQVLPELWDRIVFNGLVGNGDDHPRNHALLFLDGKWRLSPAFDIVPMYHPRESVALAMPFLNLTPTRATAAVTADNLLRCAPQYGVAMEQARTRLTDMLERIQAEWHDVLTELGAPATVADETKPVVDWVATVLKQVRAIRDSDLQAPKPGKRRGWAWAP